MDEHIVSGEGRKDGKGKKKGIQGRELTQSEKREIERKWEDKMIEAHTIAKMRGKVPAGIERLIGGLHEEKIDWRSLLQRYIMNSIPYNHSYHHPHKKSISIGTYLPDIVKEKIDIGICVDVSGSIGEGELKDFLSEIIGLAKAFQEKISMTIYFHETEINDEYEIENGNIEKIMDMKIHGGGGTSHIQPFEHIRENLKESKCVIFLTDGYSDLNEINFEEYPFDKLFVISEGGDDIQLKGKPCEIIHLKDEK